MGVVRIAAWGARSTCYILGEELKIKEGTLDVSVVYSVCIACRTVEPR